MSLIPGLGIVKGMALTLRRFFEPKVTITYPEVPARRPAQVPRPPAAALRRVGHAQVRDLLPVRPGLPDRVHRHGRHRHEAAATTSTGAPPETYGERREESALRRSGRPVPDPAYAPFDADRPRRRSTRSSRSFDHDPKRMLDDPRGDPGRVRLPAGRGAQADQPEDRRLVRDDLRHRQLLPPPPVRAAGGDRRRPPRSTRHRPAEATYLAGARRVARRRRAARRPGRHGVTR